MGLNDFVIRKQHKFSLHLIIDLRYVVMGTMKQICVWLFFSRNNESKTNEPLIRTNEIRIIFTSLWKKLNNFSCIVDSLLAFWFIGNFHLITRCGWMVSAQLLHWRNGVRIQTASCRILGDLVVPGRTRAPPWYFFNYESPWLFTF